MPSANRPDPKSRKLVGSGTRWIRRVAKVGRNSAPGSDVCTRTGVTSCTTPLTCAVEEVSEAGPWANPSGVVQLVTPVRVFTTLTGTTPLFGVLRIHFIPEPGTFLLFGSGVVAMGIAGRRRVKKN